MANETNDIKYIGLQPLTGGMLCGTMNAVGHSPECLISYPGFDSVSKDKNGNIIRAANEYHLLKYLEKKNLSVPYYQFDRAPFQDDFNMDPKFIQNGVHVDHPKYENIDLVVAVPVCSGLSTATIGTFETKRTRNNNMLYLANYALRVIKPKVYIFENAPTFMGHAGEAVRSKLEQLAKETHYSIAYYKTDTLLHDNCQRRPRTFIYFFKEDDSHKGVPELGFESKTVSIKEFLDRIPKNATQQFTISMGPICDTMVDYYHSKNDPDWRHKLKATVLVDDLIKSDELEKWRDWVNDNDNYSDNTKKKVSNYVAHIRDKQDKNLGFWRVSPVVTKNEHLPSAMHKTINAVFHYNEDRCYTVREWLSTMGMPYDFEMQGTIPLNYYKQIGQNVPARTAQFIVEEAVKVINNWDSAKRINASVVFFDNTKQTSTVFS